MPLQNSFSTTETEESDIEDNSPRTEKISPQKPRRLRMMERTKKRWHRIFNSQSKKATVSVQLDEATDDLCRILFKTANLKPEDVLTKFNEMILPLVKVEVEDERTTKGAKKTTKTAQKKKGGK